MNDKLQMWENLYRGNMVFIYCGPPSLSKILRALIIRISARRRAPMQPADTPESLFPQFIRPKKKSANLIIKFRYRLQIAMLTQVKCCHVLLFFHPGPQEVHASTAIAVGKVLYKCVFHSNYQLSYVFRAAQE